MSAKLMTLHTLIYLPTGIVTLLILEGVMNSLILTSLSISDFLETLSFTITYVDCFMFVCIFMLFVFIEIFRENPLFDAKRRRWVVHNYKSNEKC